MKKVLVVDDNALERVMLSRMLSVDYEVLGVESGAEMLGALRREGASVSAVILDIVMPEMDGYEALRRIRANDEWKQLPVIVSTALTDEESQIRAMSLGANGFAAKPYNPKLLLYTLQNAIELHEKSALLNALRNDPLTGLLNRSSFMQEAEAMIRRHPAGYFILACCDVENFKTVNDQYGTEGGDEVLRHVAQRLNRFAEEAGGLACRFNADKFAALYPASLRDSGEAAETLADMMNPKCIGRKIRIRAGRYVVDERDLSVGAMFDRAALAEESIKGRYDAFVADFDSAMIDKLRREQKIVNEMADCLRTGQFEPWFQPQYNHATGAMIGAEALVRWRKDGRLVPPGDFIPIFERNGFIYEMDKYIWRRVCALLRRWLDDGRAPLPVSVNVSRHDIFQEDFVERLCGYVAEYRLPADMLRVEITESAFADSPAALVRIVEELTRRGFTVEIDDFGSGYSSLNMLKDVPASILKLDMRFLEGNGESKRGGSILESVVRMAKWIGMSVIAEGVEDRTQADYLKSIGCNYIQGYFYAKPLPSDAYGLLLDGRDKEPRLSGVKTLDTLNSNEFWNPSSMETLIFNSYVGGASIVEYHGGVVERVRANDRFTQEFAGARIGGVPVSEMRPDQCLDPENLRVLLDGIERAVRMNKEATCEICVSGLDAGCDPALYMRCTMRVIAWTDDRALLYCVANNVTAQRLAEQKERGVNAELLDNLPCGAGLYEYDGKTLRAVHLNREYWEMVGRAPQKDGSADAMETVHPDDRAALLPELVDAISQKRDAVCDARILSGEGSYRKFHIVVRVSAKSDARYSLYAFFLPATEEALLLEERNKSRREKNRLDFLFRNAAVSLWSYNMRTGEIIQNERSREVHGFGAVVTGVPESLVRNGFIHPDSADDYIAMYARLKSGAKEAEGVFRVRNAERTGYWYEHVRYAAISDGSADNEMAFGISSDVTAEYEQDNAIRQWMALISDMQVENSAICECNLTQNVFVREQGNLFPPLDFPRAGAFDAYVMAWARGNVHPDDAEKVVEFLRRDKLLKMRGRGVLDGGIDYRAVIRGETRWCSLSIKFVKYPADEDVRLIMVHSDINSRKENELRLIDESRHDPLTGVLNRKAFEKQVNENTTRMPDATHALFMIDLDDFKNVNDNFGHITGDAVLQKAACGLRALLRDDDLVGRIGGDEFMVFLKNIPNRDVIAQRAQKILDMLRAVLDEDVRVSGSLGIALAPKDGRSFEQLYRCADKAAYYSKQHGKNRATFFEQNGVMENAYDEGAARAADESAMKAWEERMKRVLDENQRLIQRQEEDERYRLVIESTHIVTFEWNALTGRFAASPEFFEYVLSEQGGQRFFSQNVDVTGIHPDDRALFYGRFLEKVLSRESVPEMSLRLALRKGGYRWCRLGALVQFDGAERLTKAIGIITVENVYKKRPDMQLDAVFKYMSAGVILLEIGRTDITALYISESYFRLENTDGITASGGDALRCVHEDDCAPLKNKLRICAISGAVMEETFRVVRNGRISWRHMHAVRIPYPDAPNPVMIAVETDITDMKRREEALKSKCDRLTETLRALGVATTTE